MSVVDERAGEGCGDSGAKADRLAAEQEMAQARALRIQAERERLMAMRARALGY